MSEQINEKVETVEVEETQVDTPVVQEPVVEDKPPVQQQFIVLPSKQTIGQRIVDTAVTMVASSIVVGATNAIVNGATKVARIGATKAKGFMESRKEKKLEKKAAKEAAKLKELQDRAQEAVKAASELEKN